MKYRSLVLAIAGLASNLANAEEVKSPQSTDLGSIQVVAAKVKAKDDKKVSMAEQKQSTGLSLPALSSSDANPEDGYTTIRKLENMSGVMLQGGARNITQNVVIGGLDGDQVFVSIDGINNQLSFFRHGHNSARQLPNPFLYKKVTASAGGTNILYGSGDVGGALNFTTLDPMDIIYGDSWYGAQVTGGAQSGAPGGNVGGAAAFKADEGFSFLFDVIGEKNNNVRLANGDSLDNSSAQNIQYLAKAVWDVDQHQQFKLSYLAMNNSGSYPTNNNKPESASNPATDFTFNQGQSNLIYGYNPNNPYVDLEVQAFYNFNNIKSNALTGIDVPEQNILLTQMGINTRNATTIYEQHLLYGTDYQYLEGKDKADSGQFEQFPDSTQQLYSIFLQDSWDIIDSLNLTIGGRMNGYYSQSQNSSANQGVLFTKQATLTYEIIEKWSVYIGYNEGFRIPNLQELYLSGYHVGSGTKFFVANPDLSPEVSHIKTVGTNFAYDISSTQSFNVGGNFFLNNVDNYIVFSDIAAPGDTPPIQRQNVNIPDAVLYGFEVNGGYVNEWFEFVTNFTYTRGYSQSDYVNGGGNVIAAGNPLPIPRAKGYISLTFPIEFLQSSFNINSNYAVRQNFVPQGSAVDPVPGYMLLGIAYTYEPTDMLEGLNVTVGIDNLLNQNYDYYDANNLYFNPAMGRNFYGQATYRF
ncbi:TonB-dependent receptor [Francisellaceae bacterium]|nr:TonB-dependent receptor [Francisellaceae bacterium]